MRFLRIYLTLIIVVLSFIASTQEKFYKVYSSNGYDYGQGIVQLEDSSYAVCGSSSSFLDAPSQAFLLKLDKNGNFVWSRHYGGNEFEWGRRVLYKKNFGYFITGYTNSMGNGGYDAYLVKTDESGILEWEKTYGESGWERINDAALTRDSGVLMVGETNSTLNGDNDIYLVRTNKLGDTLWTRKWGGSGEDRANGIVALNDSVYVIGGERYIEDSLMLKGFVFAIHENGTLLWSDTLGKNGEYGINDVTINTNESIIDFVGWRFNTVVNDKNPFSGRLFFNGTLDYDIEQSNNGPNILQSITHYGPLNKTYIAYTYTDPSSFQDGFDISIARFTQDLWWDNSYVLVSYPKEDIVGDLIKTSDGGAISVGYFSEYGAGGANVYVLKIGPGDDYPNTTGTPFPNSIVNVYENQLSDDFNVYPNPFNEKIQVNPYNADPYILEILDIQGRVVERLKLMNQASIETSDLLQGSYLLNIKDQNDQLLGTRKMIKY